MDVFEVPLETPVPISWTINYITMERVVWWVDPGKRDQAW